MKTIEECYKHIGERIYQLRMSKNWTTAELASKMKSPWGSLGRTSITHIEHGNQRILLHHLFKFAEVFEVSPSYLLGEE